MLIVLRVFGMMFRCYSPADRKKSFLKRSVVQQCVEKMERALTNVSKINMGETTVKNLCFMMFFIAF
jgi:hypothetical protein